MRGKDVKILPAVMLALLIFQASHQVAYAMDTSAQSAILVDINTGQELYKKDIYTQRKIASTTKVMTAILAIESGKMDEYVTITPEMLQTEGSSIYLKAGDKVKLSDLVYGLMLRSGNDAALSIATYVGGSVDGFVYQMNETAKLIGMENTNFTNPHGLDDGDKHYSCASDMAILIQYAMKDKMFRTISGTKAHEATYADGTKQVWGNKNKLLTSLYEYSTGGKTGYTKKAGKVLVSTAEKDGINLGAVTINAPNMWDDHINLFEYGFNNFSKRTFLEKGNITDIKDKFYKKDLYIKSELYYLVNDDQDDTYEVRYVLKDPKNADKADLVNHIVGKTVLYKNDEVVAIKPIYYLPQSSETFIEVWKDTFTKSYVW